LQENTEILEIRAADHEYFHPDFHSSLNMGVDYVGEKHGKNAVGKQLEIRYNENWE